MLIDLISVSTFRNNLPYPQPPKRQLRIFLIGGVFLESFLTAFGEETSEYVEKRSRFIATLRHCETEQEANDFINEMRSKYWDAKHNVFAYSVEKGKLCRFSDDGEPHGTAGKPMLDIILGSKVKNIAVVVTRYFGGVLLGTGGLVRAYSKSVQDVLQKSQVFIMLPCTACLVECAYSDHARLINLIESLDGNIDNTDFTEKVTVSFSLKSEFVEDFSKKLCETFSGALELKEIGEKLTPFKK